MFGWPENMTVWNVLLVLYWAVVIIVLIAENREPSTTLAWILVLSFLPVVGLVFYFFAGRDWAYIEKRNKWVLARESIRQPYMAKHWSHWKDEVTKSCEILPSSVSSQVMASISNQSDFPPLFARKVEIFTDGAEYFEALLQDLSQAQDSINMQYFIWGEDELTDRIVDVLIERLIDGVEVRILNDFLGTLRYSKKGIFRLRKAGAQILFDVTAIAKINYRNHRKITIIDGLVGHTGGFNIAQEYIDGGKRYKSWRDTGLRLEGPCIFALQDLFAQRWFEVGRESLYLNRFFPFDRVGYGDVLTQVAAQGAEDYWRVAARSYEEAISSAEKSVFVQSPYYVPSESMEAALVNAALAGVEVHLMMTGVPDKRSAWFAAFTYLEKLCRAGVHVYLYEAGFFHAKSIAVDDSLSSIGTLNLDVRSLELHKEMTVWMYDEKIAVQNREIFIDDIASCREITLEELAELGPARRFRNSAFRLFSKLL